jgi:hypothetical protein
MVDTQCLKILHENQKVYSWKCLRKCNCIFSAPYVNELFFEKYDSRRRWITRKNWSILIQCSMFDLHFFTRSTLNGPHCWKKKSPTLLFYQGSLSPISTTMGVLKLRCDTPTSVGPTQCQMALKTLENSSYTAKTTDSTNEGVKFPWPVLPSWLARMISPRRLFTTGILLLWSDVSRLKRYCTNVLLACLTKVRC